MSGVSCAVDTANAKLTVLSALGECQQGLFAMLLPAFQCNLQLISSAVSGEYLDGYLKSGHLWSPENRPL
jgi:hypothetical protein